MRIYQVLPRLWGNGKFSAWDKKSLEYVKSLGMSHIWFTGIPRHASGEPFVKGNPGCPYSVKDWFDTNPYLADNENRRLEEFEALVSRCHEAGLKVVTDFIPNHVSKDYSGPIPTFDHCDYDWTDTLKINYNHPDTPKKMLEVLIFWAAKGVDAFRCDMVELIPMDKMKWLISELKMHFPHVKFIAEVYQKQNYREYIQNVGFDLLYDKSGIYDSLISIMEGHDSVASLTRNWQSIGDLQSNMLNFLENHDEKRLQSPDYAALAFSALFNEASFMLYFGQEIDERAEESDNQRTSIFDIIELPSIKRLTRTIHNEDSLTRHEKECLERHRRILSRARDLVDWKNYDLLFCNPSDKVFPFLRFVGPDYNLTRRSRACLFVCNFNDRPETRSIYVPEIGCYEIEVPAHDFIEIQL